MAKIDTTLIEGYADMTPEEKLAALEAFEYDDGATEIERYKKASSKASTEAADWKRKYNDRLSEEERKQQESDDELSALRAKVAEMEKDKLILSYRTQLTELGYEGDLAEDTARAMADGEVTRFFANHKKFLETHDKSYKQQLMGKTPTPPAGSGASSGGVDYGKLIEDAQNRGDMAAVAYYTRLSEQEKQTN